MASQLRFLDRDHDARVRNAAFEWLKARVSELGDVLPRPLLAQGFEYQGRRVPLLGPQGIFKPRVMDVPLSITTSPNGPYDDGLGPDGYLSYRYRGTDPNHRDNRGLAFAMRESLPLVYFFGLVPGRYLALWPALIVAARPEELTFSVALDDAAHATVSGAMEGAEAGDIRRQYITTLARRRVHQRAFRERVLRAYRSQCALCHLKHGELLDAAHIVPDAEEEGEPVVSNGLALCRLHHGAFDRFFLGVRPDYVIEVRPDVLEEEDGPTLKHAIQGLHGKRIILPRRPEDRPEPELLEVRYGRFREKARAG